MKTITVNVKPAGNSCNLQCAYCDANIHHGKRDEFQFANFEKYLQYLVKHYDYANFILHGGEPLIAGLQTLREIIDMCHLYFADHLSIQVQSNGLLFTEKIMDFLHAKHCKFSVSFDPLQGLQRYDLPKWEHVKGILATMSAKGYQPGVVTVAHAQNIKYIPEFINMLMDVGVPYWTINKIRTSPSDSLYLSELDYVTMLETIMTFWIDQGLYQKIQIQPFMDLLQQGENHSCLFSSLLDKCHSFHVFDGSKLKESCEHFNEDNLRHESCKNCNIFDFCGGGCPSEIINQEFCMARRQLKASIARLL